MPDYKNTLNLPTPPSRCAATSPSANPAGSKAGRRKSATKAIRKAAVGRPKFILHDGPPYANGDIHIGHAVNKILKDIIVKSKTLSGFDAPYVPAGTATACRSNCRSRSSTAGHRSGQIPRAVSRIRCHADRAAESRFHSPRRIGRLEHPYRTMDFPFEADALRVLGQIQQAGYPLSGGQAGALVRRLWLGAAEAEVEYEDKTSPAIDVGFAVADPADLARRFDIAAFDAPTQIVIWTTTP